MAKPQKKKTRPSWVQRQIERFGENFVAKKQPNEIQREALNIVRDIMRGNIKVDEIEYLFDLKILTNVQNEINSIYSDLYISSRAMLTVMQLPGGVQMLQQQGVNSDSFQRYYAKINNELTAYGAVLNAISSMIAFIQTPYPKAQEHYLNFYSTVQSQLNRFKYII